jgi:hypothetical protein
MQAVMVDVLERLYYSNDPRDKSLLFTSATSMKTAAKNNNPREWSEPGAPATLCHASVSELRSHASAFPHSDEEGIGEENHTPSRAKLVRRQYQRGLQYLACKQGLACLRACVELWEGPGLGGTAETADPTWRHHFSAW